MNCSVITFIAGQALEDQCSKKPCQNGGECIQIKYGRYKCDCQGTKYHGEHCEMGNIIHLKIKIQYSLFNDIYFECKSYDNIFQLSF